MSENPSEINDMNNTKVYCRFRPMTRKESDFSPEQISSISSSTILNLTTAKQKNIFSFNFDHIFPPNSSQEEIYNICARNSVENFLLGYNSSIIIHGEKKIYLNLFLIMRIWNLLLKFLWLIFIKIK